MITLPQPPLSASSPQAINNYLIQMVGYLNIALNSLNTDSLAPEFRDALAAVDRSIEAEKEAAEKGMSQFSALKSLIIKTADEIYSSMDSKVEEFNGSFEAISDNFGTFREELTNLITTDATGIRQELADEQQINDEFRKKITSRIKIGKIDGTDDYGVYIGDYSEFEQDGQIIQRDDDYITITAQRITFGKNEQPVAYISNNKLYISDAHITSQFDIGYTDGGDGKWRVMGEPGRGYVIKWIGGAVI